MSLLASALLLSVIQGDDMRLLRFPTIHGDQVVFTYAGDLWTSTTSGGVARRLTSHPGSEQNAKFSPDGSQLAFTASYDGNPDVYVMPSEGGEPKRLTYSPEPDSVVGWSPDGKVLYKSPEGSLGGFTARLWIVPSGGGLPQPTHILEMDQGSMSPDGTKLAYNRAGSHQFNWRRYRGGTQGRISFWDFTNNSYSEIPSGRENSWLPMWVGDMVYYLSDKVDGTVNIYSYDTKSKQVKQLTSFKDADIKWPNTDGKKIIFERDGDLWTYTIATGKVDQLAPKVIGDKVAARPRLVALGNQISDISLSPSGARVAVEARGFLFSVPAKSGETRMLVDWSASRERNPIWSPDGQTIAYLSDKTGEYEIYTVPQRGGEPKQLTKNGAFKITGIQWSPDGKSISFDTVQNDLMILDVATQKTAKVFTGRYNGARQYDWSPDSAYIAYVDAGTNLTGALFIYDVKSGKTTQITEGYYRDDAVTWDLNGKYLYLISSRTFNHVQGAFEDIMQMENPQRIYVLPLTKELSNPLTPPSDEEPEKSAPKEAKPAEGAKGVTVKIDFEGLAGRALALPMPSGTYAGIVGLDGGVLYITDGKIGSYDLDQRQQQDITVEPVLAGPAAIAFNPNRTKMAYFARGVLGIVDIRPGIKVGDGRVNTSGVEAIIDPRQEWNQIYWEAWRYERDRFYDPNYTGVDWNQVGKHYALYLPFVANRADLNYILGLMVGEFGTSHSYVGGGDMGPMPAPVPIGALGADLAKSGEYVKIQHIYVGNGFEEQNRGPLTMPGLNVKEGDYLLAIDGHPVRSNANPDQFLINKVGKNVVLTINSQPSTTGSRNIVVRPIGSDQDLRYIDWVEGNRKKVAELSGGKIGYLHLPNTSEEGIVEFVRGFYSQSDKEAMVIDERFNGGGYIPTFFVEKLARKYISAFRQRNGADVGFPVQALDGPKVMLINQYAGSGGDMLPWLFKEMGIGPLIGKRTWGGLVGITGNANLVDGGGVTAPEFGLYDVKTGKWIAENNGIDPDIDVDARPDLLAQGKDPQLEKAVDWLLSELKKSPKQQWKRPDFPVNVKKGGGG